MLVSTKTGTNALKQLLILHKSADVARLQHVTRKLTTSSCCLSEKKDFSRFKVPAVNTLPEEVIEGIIDVTEKLLISHMSADVARLQHVTRKLTTSSCCLSEKKDFSRFKVPAVNTLPEDVQERIIDVTEKSGFTPNVFSGMSYRPEESRAFFNYYDVVMNDRPGGNLTKADKEMIVVATSAENKCLYCIIAHSALHRIYSKNPQLADQIAANWKTADLDERQRAILEVAIDLCHCKPLTEDKCDNLRKHGLTDDDIWDIGAVVALFALSNRMAFTMNLKPNQEFYLLGRVKKEKK